MINEKVCKKRVLLLILLAFLMIFVLSAVVVPVDVQAAQIQTAYYVDPVNGNDNNDGVSTATAFRTITKARDVVRATKGTMTGDIVVNLRGGTYTLTSTLSFNENDSGNNGYRIYYKAYNGEIPAITGGQKITGWTLYSGNIYRASVSGISTIRQLYVNDKRAQRAHTETNLTNVSNWNDPGVPDDPNDVPATFNGIITNDSQVQYFTNPSDVELHWTSNWRDAYGKITEIADGGNGYKIMKGNMPWFHVFFHGYNQGYNNVTIENAYELLNQPGEFYYNKATSYLYYWPRTGENMSTADVYAPKVESLLDVRGSSLTNKVYNITFYGLTFQYGTWLKPDTQGYSNEQAGYLDNLSHADPAPLDLMPANITVDCADGITFERNTIKHMGGAGINFINGVRNSNIIGNKFLDISASAIQLGEQLVYGQGSIPAGKEVCYNDKVMNNYIDGTGVEFWGSVGIAGYTTDTLEISHNELYNLPYTAITSGWGWARTPNDYNKNNIISYNRIRNFMNKLYDGGGIYTLGHQTNIQITGNYISTNNNVYSGIYPDEGSSNETISNNVLENMYSYWLMIWTSSINNINASNNYSTTSSIRNDGTNCTVTNTTVNANALWPVAGQNVIAESGLESSYRDILPAADAVTSSVVTYYWKAPNATDGDINTCWSSESTGGQTGTEWIYLRLPGYQAVTGVVLTPRTSGTCFPVDFKFQYSDDGKNWTDIAGQSYTDYVQPSNQSPITFTFGSSVTARYIRLYATKFRTDTYGYYYVQLAEMGYTSSGGAPATPPTGSLMWLKADAGITKDANSYVSTWADQSGNGKNMTQSTQAYKPRWYDNAINYKPALYSELDDAMAAAGVTGSMNNFTLSFVIKPGILMDYDNALGASGGWGQFLFHGSANGTIYAGTSASSRIVTASGTLETNKVQIYTYRFGSGTANLYKNGVLINTATVGNPASWTGFTFFQIEGLLPEIILYNSTLSDTNIQLLHAYLNNKYGTY